MERQRKTVDEMLAKVPREVAVPRDLWPEVERHIGQQRRRVRSFALAASLAGVVLAGAMAWLVVHSRPPTGTTPAAAVARAVDFDEPRNPAYLAARAELEKSFNERLGALEPATRIKIEASLALIRQAHLQIRQALATDPANPVLEHLLDSTWHDEFDLYEAVVQGTQPTVLRS